MLARTCQLLGSPWRQREGRHDLLLQWLSTGALIAPKAGAGFACGSRQWLPGTAPSERRCLGGPRTRWPWGTGHRVTGRAAPRSTTRANRGGPAPTSRYREGSGYRRGSQSQVGWSGTAGVPVLGRVTVPHRVPVPRGGPGAGGEGLGARGIPVSGGVPLPGGGVSAGEGSRCGGVLGAAEGPGSGRGSWCWGCGSRYRGVPTA